MKFLSESLPAKSCTTNAQAGKIAHKWGNQLAELEQMGFPPTLEAAALCATGEARPSALFGRDHTCVFGRFAIVEKCMIPMHCFHVPKTPAEVRSTRGASSG